MRKVPLQPIYMIVTRKHSFAYIKDPIFHFSITIYLFNRFLLKPFMPVLSNFWHNYLNDLICIPFCLPIVLWITRKTGLRTHDDPPDIYELCFYFLIWSFMFERVGPVYGKYFNNPVGILGILPAMQLGLFLLDCIGIIRSI